MVSLPHFQTLSCHFWRTVLHNQRGRDITGYDWTLRQVRAYSPLQKKCRFFLESFWERMTGANRSDKWLYFPFEQPNWRSRGSLQRDHGLEKFLNLQNSKLCKTNNMCLLVIFQRLVLLQLPRLKVLCLVITTNIIALFSSGASKVLHCVAQQTVSVLMGNGTRQFLIVKVIYI